MVAESIGRNYNRLHALCCHGKHGYFDARSPEDIFQDTVVFVIQDAKAQNKSNNDFIEHFMFRFRMIEFQAQQDAKQLKSIPYANYKQTTSQTDQDW